MEKRKIVYFIIAAIAFPIAIDWLVFSNAFPSHITNEAWAGFLGSYIGSLCTMAAVFITISDNPIASTSEASSTILLASNSIMLVSR